MNVICILHGASPNFSPISSLIFNPSDLKTNITLPAMGKGKKIECPLGGGAKKKRRAEPEPQGSAIVAGQVDASDARYVNHRIQAIEQALVRAGNGNPIQVDHQPLEDAIAHEEPHDGQAHLEDNYIDNFLAAPQHPEEEADVNITNSKNLPGCDYKSKRILEHKNWMKAIPPMFISYMKLAQKTSEWGNTLNWNHDYNEQCSCGAGDLRTRNIDVVDILGEISNFMCRYYHHQD